MSTSLFESSESVSSLRPKASAAAQYSIEHGYKFVVVDHPVPCVLCHCDLHTREEQVAHYHSDPHIVKLRERCAQRCGEIWQGDSKKRSDYMDNNADVEIIKVDLDGDQNELSQISHISALEFECSTCRQYFKSENALKAHLNTQKHMRNERKRIQAERNAQEAHPADIRTEVLEHTETIE